YPYISGNRFQYSVIGQFLKPSNGCLTLQNGPPAEGLDEGSESVVDRTTLSIGPSALCDWLISVRRIMAFLLLPARPPRLLYPTGHGESH
ncbi:MAG: hypothetical protein ACRDDF_08615, partial [Aeromonas sp.]